MKNFKDILSKLLLYKEPQNSYDFQLPENNINDKKDNLQNDSNNQNIYNNLDVNLDYIKVKYNTLINSDIKLREFKLNIRGKKYNSLLLFIDGMINSESINNFILKPLMSKHNNNTYSQNPSVIANNILVRRVKKFDLEEYIYDSLIPQNSIKKETNFQQIFSGVNIGNCALFIDTLSVCFVIDVKGFESRSVTEPKNEIVIRGSQESFVEKLRTNTSLLRRMINNENLIIESACVGKITKTNLAICYMRNIANNALIAEVKYRINNLNVDSIISSGQLEQLIQDENSIFPQIIASERPDKAANHLLEGRVVVLVNGSPHALIMPGVFVDFLSSPEDLNLKFQYSNLLKTIRIFAFIITLFLPGIYVAISNYHTELLPTELLFTIAASRNTVPFPIIFEILLMEISFELIREAGLRVPTPIGPTIRHCWCINPSDKRLLVPI